MVTMVRPRSVGSFLISRPTSACANRSASSRMAVATSRLTALATVPRADLLFLDEHCTAVANAVVAAPGQWKDWWWVCVGGEVVFIPFVFLMTGRWSPKKAREDAAEHARLIQDELAAIQE